MQKVRDIVKGYYNVIHFVVLTAVLFACCWTEVAVWIALAIALLFCFKLNKEMLLTTFLFMSSFEIVFNQTIIKLNILTLIKMIILCFIVVKYLIEVIKKERKLNFRIIIPVAMYIVFLMIPISILSIKIAIDTLVFFVLIYLIKECGDEISLLNPARGLAGGLIVSSLFSLFKNKSARLASLAIKVVESDSYVRFSGLKLHPNSFAVMAVICLAVLLLMMIMNKINFWEFFTLFIPIFAFGYQTISRNFVLGMFVCGLTFLIIYIFKFKLKSWKVLVCLALCVVSLIGILNVETTIYLKRFGVIQSSVEVNCSIVNCEAQSIQNAWENNSEYDQQESADYENLEYMSDEWWRAVYDGKIKYDPGRVGIWKMYIKDWFSSPTVFLFGRGTDAAPIGQMAAHNALIEIARRNGIVGILFLVAIIISFINFKQFKLKHFYPLLVLILPFLTMSFFESLNMHKEFYIFLILSSILIYRESGRKNHNE